MSSLSDKSIKKSGVLAPGQRHKNHVVIKDANKKKKSNEKDINMATIFGKEEPLPATSPASIGIKDEVELLRAGFKDKDGNTIKSQALKVPTNKK